MVNVCVCVCVCVKDFHSCRLLYVRFRNPALAFLLLFNNTGGGGGFPNGSAWVPLVLWGPQVAASSHTGCPSQPVLGERDKGLEDQLGAERYREELYLGRKRSGPESGRGGRVRSHGAPRAVPAVAAGSPLLLGPRIQLP